MDRQALAAAIEGRLPFAEKIFDDLERQTKDGEGVTRAAYSPEDQLGIDMIAAAAQDLGLEVEHDFAGNVYATLPGADRSAPAVLSGSHLDSVPKGGNYDGAAGAVAALTVLAALVDLGITPARDMRCVGLRGEESVWYGIAYIGSRLATGSLDAAEVDRLQRGDTGRSLADHMAELGIDMGAMRAGPAPSVTAANTAGFLELHIEQGPILIDRKMPVAIPTVIRGNMRFPYARCLGAYAHSAAVPRENRQDAVLATVELVRALDEFWQTLEADGNPDTVFTVGKLFTDADEHAMTKVPGECQFTINFGGTAKGVLDRARDRTEALAAEIAAHRNVTFELGECVGSDPTPIDDGLRGHLHRTAGALDIAAHDMPTVGHDASIFARAGIPSAMVLVRNQHGSHNADEAMEMDDFGLGVQVMGGAMFDIANS